MARSGRTLDLAFVILDALDPEARADDAIIPLPGGPGETFTDLDPSCIGASPLTEFRIPDEG